MSFPVDATVAVSLIKYHLSGFPGFPKDDAGVNVFARCLQECCVSVEHAAATLELFDEEFPTMKQIIQTATNLRAKFEPTEEQLADWKKRYGKPDKVTPDFTPSPEPEYVIRDRKIREHIMKQNNGVFPGWDKLSWIKLFEAQEAVGYPLTPEQAGMIGR